MLMKDYKVVVCGLEIVSASDMVDLNFTYPRGALT